MSGVDPHALAFFIPPGLAKFKQVLFNRVAEAIRRKGGQIIRDDYSAVALVPEDKIPVIGCTPQFRPLLDDWRKRGRRFIYWDRGYFRRLYAAWLPRGFNGGYYRWAFDAAQMKEVRAFPDDRWRELRYDQVVKPWRKHGGRIVVADTGPDYWDLFSDRGWTARTVEELKRYTDRPIFIRSKESPVPLGEELADAHALVTHGSIAAVEAVVMGCPVFVDEISAAKFMGLTDFSLIERPVYPDRTAWVRSLAYSQFNEPELTDGTLFRLLW